jgi:hypothetical protein
LRRGRWRLWEEKKFGILGIVNLCKCVFFGPQLMTGPYSYATKHVIQLHLPNHSGHVWIRLPHKHFLNRI